MTISYNVDIASSNALSFLKIIFRWKGSLWKNVIHELIFWCIAYTLISLLYRLVLSTEQQLIFAKIAHLIDGQLVWLPLTFILAFFVSNVVERWKSMFHNVGFIDRSAFVVCHHIIGDDDETRIIRRNILRYLCLTQLLVLRDISTQVRNRFQNMQSVIESGYLTKQECKLLFKSTTEYPVYWVPINWSMALVHKARSTKKITADVLYNNIAAEIFKFHEHIRTLLNYDWVPVPLVYPQVVFMTVRIYFLLCLISRQYIINDEAPNKAKIDLYIPFMTIIEFLLQMGWLKVGEAIMNPMGEDDDDLELNYIIDRNISIAMAMTERLHEVPDTTEDCFKNGIQLLYPEGTVRTRTLMGSAAQLSQLKSVDEVPMVNREDVVKQPKLNETIPSSFYSAEITGDTHHRARKRKRSEVASTSETSPEKNEFKNDLNEDTHLV